MYPIINSTASKANQALKKDLRKKTETNVNWLSRVIKDSREGIKLVLLGGTDPIDFRLRVAQSHLRHDLSPSSWSHVLILDEPGKDFGNTKVHEISLYPRDGFGFPPPVNGLQVSAIKKYKDTKAYPNIAILSLPLSNKDLNESVEKFKTLRSAVDSLELIIKWLSFVWGVGKTSNPIFDGFGIPSAVMIEVITSSLGFELTPGISSNTSCPEAIWQSVKWWHKFYKEQNSEIISGYYFRSHEICETGDF